MGAILTHRRTQSYGAVAMARRKKARYAAALAAPALAYVLSSQVDRRRVQRDPEWELLRDPERGRALSVTGGDGNALHVEVFGPEDAPTIVLAHGWMCSLTFWTRQIQSLAGEFRIVAYDLRGHGRSPEPEEQLYSLQALADDLEAVLEATLDPDDRALVVGHSMGAMQLGAWVERHPGSLRRLAGVGFVNTGLGDLINEALVLKIPEPLGRARQQIGRVVLGTALPLPQSRGPVSHRAVRYVALSPNATPAQVAFCENMVLQCGPGVRAGFGRAMSEMELHDALEHLTVPALVVAGKADKLTPLAHAERVAETLPQVHALVELEGVGHMGPIEAAEEVSEAIRGLASAAWPSTSASSTSRAASPS